MDAKYTLPMVWIWVIAFSLISVIGSISLAGILLVFPDATRKFLLPSLISYAAGTLLGASFLGLLPEAANAIGIEKALEITLLGILLFFLLEKAVIWRHRHETSYQDEKTAGTLILVGDTFHNFLDGVVIVAAFFHSIPLGMTASLATVAHEVPQEVSDFALLLQSGYSRSRALLWNFLSGSGTLLGAILGYLFLEPVKGAIPYIMLLAGASFLYIATADIVPTLHRYRSFTDSVLQFILLLLGIFTIVALRTIQH